MAGFCQKRREFVRIGRVAVKGLLGNFPAFILGQFGEIGLALSPHATDGLSRCIGGDDRQEMLFGELDNRPITASVIRPGWGFFNQGFSPISPSR